MTHDQAVELIAVLASYFRQEVTDETAVLWSRELVGFDLDDGLEAAELAGKTQIYMPNLAEFLALVKDCRNTRMVLAHPRLRSAPDCCEGQGFGHWYREHADDAMRARSRALLEMPKRYRYDEVVIRETFARVVGGKS